MPIKEKYFKLQCVRYKKGMNRIADKAFFTVNFLVDNLFFRYAFGF